MRRSEWEDRCKKHPDHILSKGVCPYCLRERLSHLSASSSTTAATSTTNASSAASTACSSGPYLSSSDPSPLHDQEPNKTASLSQLLKGRTAAHQYKPFGKSKFVIPVINEQEEDSKKRKKKKKKKKKKTGRFWSKLLFGSERRKNDLFHSETMEEKPSSKWVLF